MHPAAIGPFQVLRELGRGGMGEIFLARDTQLDRQVAIKALPADLAADRDRLERFEREAKILASLNHPGIGAIYGLAEAEGRRYLVLEYVDGQTLTDRLARGPMPVEEAVSTAKQIAEALEAAHERGIIHRDLKPANVMVTAEGKVKVLDFGLARTADTPVSSAHAAADSPTVVSPRPGASPTIAGVIMGTAGYMSPEQARGRPVDKRSDIFSFGCVLYEMLTGSGPFPGETVTDSLGATLHRDPDWTRLPANTPTPVRRLLRLCLAKNKTERLRDIGDARLELEPSAGEQTPPPSRSALRGSLLGAVAVVCLVAGSIAGVLLSSRRGPATGENEPTHVELSLQPAEMLGPVTAMKRPFRPAIALTPDGRAIVFAGMVGKTWQLFRRSLGADAAVALPGTEGASSPFLSPDGEWVAFLAGGEIRKTPVSGGAVVRVTRLADGGLPSPSPLVPAEEDFFGGAWGGDGTIVFGRFNDGLWQVPAAGGVSRPLTPGPAKAQRLPHFLPDGRGILVTGRSDDDLAVAVIPRSGGKPRAILENGSDARFVPPSHLVFASDGMLMAARFDLERLEVVGPPEPVIPSVLHSVEGPRPARNVGAGQFDVSASGSLVFAQGGVYPIEPMRLVWASRDGTIRPVGIPDGYFARPSLSPDGRRLAVAYVPVQGKLGDVTVCIHDSERGTFARLWDKPAWGPLWSAEGSAVYMLRRGGDRSVWSVPIDGASPPTRTTRDAGSHQISCELPDRAGLVLSQYSEQTGSDIVLAPRAGGLRPWLATPANEAWANISPDGKTMAYGSDASGRFEVYLQPFPGPGPRVQVSTEGGDSPLWSHSGKELFFLRSTGKEQTRTSDVCVVQVHPGPPVSVGTPGVLFSGRIQALGGITNYDVSPDDQRLLMVQNLEGVDTPSTQLHLILNWAQELTKHPVPRSAR